MAELSEHRRQRRVWYLVGGLLVAAFLVYGATSFRSYLTPYVSFDEARQRGGTVQVKGSLVPGSPDYSVGDQVLRFGLADGDSQPLTVVYRGPRPANFEEATQVVAIGAYRDGTFHAEHLLVKCPSKYQGVDQDPDRHSTASSG